jgi:hypothetical protein
MMRTRELTGGKWTAAEVYGESLSSVLADAALLIARTERTHPATGAVYNERGAVRIHHAEHEDGHQLVITFEGS